MKVEYWPSFFGSEKASMRYHPDIAKTFQEGVEFGLQRKLKLVPQLMAEDAGHALVITDLQEDFRDGGRLPVKGTNDVVLRTCCRLLNGVVSDFYAGIIFSLDGHPMRHISFDYTWRDENGHPLDLSYHGRAAMLTLVDEAQGIFKAEAFRDGKIYTVGFYRSCFDKDNVVAYWKYLQGTRQGPLWVFVPHCVIGTDGVDLHPLLAETIAFASGARGIQPTVIHKGHIAGTDWFGPLEPCRPTSELPNGGLQVNVIEQMKWYATVEFVGVAEDFCDFAMKKQTIEHIDGAQYVKRLRFITDGTAPIVPNAGHVSELNKKALELGVKFIRCDTPFNESL